MSKMTPAKLAKKKEREKKVKAKILKRREGIRKKAKEVAAEEKERIRLQKIQNKIEGKTIINRSPEEQHARLQKNIEILQALEEQQKLYEEELKWKNVMNENKQPPRTKGMKASADVVFIPNPEVPQVSVSVEEETNTLKKLHCQSEVKFTPAPSDWYIEEKN
jgi:hypothetical protein